HIASQENFSLAFSAIVKFVGGGTVAKRAASGADSTFRTVLFTDIVGHTAMMHRLGDEKGRGVLREHEQVTRNTLKTYGGSEVKTMGDGFMASFTSITKGVECAIALQRAFDHRNASAAEPTTVDRKSTRLNSSHDQTSYAVFCLKKTRHHRTGAPLDSVEHGGDAQEVERSTELPETVHDVLEACMAALRHPS